MTLEKLYLISQLVVAVGFVVSLIFVGLQVRQNTALLRETMAADRKQANDFLLERLITDSDFRNFHYRAATEPEKFNEDDRYRNLFVNWRSLRTALGELSSYFNGHISEDEYKRLIWNLELLAKKPEIERAWAIIETQYSKKVQNHWSNILEATREKSLQEAFRI